MDKHAKAQVAHIRQTAQFTCCAASITSALAALGKPYTEGDVNKILGAAPMQGATWEAMLATLQYFGCRGQLVIPSTPLMLKEWTDKGYPVLIGWNPEGRPWSHASVVFDVTEREDGVLMVHVMDPNIPNPSRTTRVLDEDEFCRRWYEKVSDSLIVRRPACVVTLEVDTNGRQVIASKKEVVTMKRDQETVHTAATVRVGDAVDTKAGKKDDKKIVVKPEDLPKRRSQEALDALNQSGAGKHKNKQDYERGHARRPKHKKPIEREASELVMAWNSLDRAFEAKFPRGVPMTVEEVAAVVGDEFREMNENPPESVVKVREEMMGKEAFQAYRLDWRPLLLDPQTKKIVDAIYDMVVRERWDVPHHVDLGSDPEEKQVSGIRKALEFLERVERATSKLPAKYRAHFNVGDYLSYAPDEFDKDVLDVIQDAREDLIYFRYRIEDVRREMGLRAAAFRQQAAEKEAGLEEDPAVNLARRRLKMIDPQKVSKYRGRLLQLINVIDRLGVRDMTPDFIQDELQIMDSTTMEMLNQVARWPSAGVGTSIVQRMKSYRKMRNQNISFVDEATPLMEDMDAALRYIEDVYEIQEKIAHPKSLMSWRHASETAFRQLVAAYDELDHAAKFEEGKPADPTENMSEEDAEKWRKQNIFNRDNFKEAAKAWRAPPGKFIVVADPRP